MDMKTLPRILLVSLAVGGWAFGDIPKKRPSTGYTGLWTNSPFTSKPPPVVSGPVANPLDDYALAGVSPIQGGYRVTMLNKKNPEERITVDSGGSRSNDYKILSVTRKPGDPLGTVVRMSMGAVTGSVMFDEALLVLQAPPPQQVQQPQAPPGVTPDGQPQVQPQPAQPGQRQVRPRVIPPPNAAAQNQQGGQAQRGQATQGGRGERRSERRR